MSLLEFLLLFVLQFQGIIGQSYLYSPHGHGVRLPCSQVPSSQPPCYLLQWLYNRNRLKTETVFNNGKVENRADRLHVDPHCSLTITNVTAQDAGSYTCRPDGQHDITVYLSVMTVSPSPPDAVLKRDHNITLACSLSRYPELRPCQQNSIRWVKEGSTLTDDVTQHNCVSNLTVRHQRDQDRKYTCQYAEDGGVKVEASYTLEFTDRISEPDRPPDTPYVIIGAVVGALLVLVVVTILALIKYRKFKMKDCPDTVKTPDEQESHVTYASISYDGETLMSQKKGEPDENLTYATVYHDKEKTPPKKTVKEEEEEVTYSLVMKSDDLSSLYRSVGK